MKVYIVVETMPDPRIIGVYKDKSKAEKVSGEDPKKWRNVVEKELE